MSDPSDSETGLYHKNNVGDVAPVNRKSTHVEGEQDVYLSETPLEVNLCFLRDACFLTEILEEVRQAVVVDEIRQGEPGAQIHSTKRNHRVLIAILTTT